MINVLWYWHNRENVSVIHTVVRAVLVVILCATILGYATTTQGAERRVAQKIDWSALLRDTWEGYKQRNIYCGEPCAGAFGLVHDPSQNHDSVSEGVGYGLLMAVLMDAPTAFNDIYDGAEHVLVDPLTGLYNWRADKDGGIIGYSAATDADQDVAVALIFADEKVRSGQWHPHATKPYAERANELINALYDLTVVEGKYVKPGDAWAGDGKAIMNPSYFAPAWYRIFDKFQGTERWQPVIDQGYASLNLNPGAPLGLAPDWMSAEGQSALDFCDKLERPEKLCRYDMTYDAIRVPWRIATDCLWFNEARACDWSKRTVEFLKTLNNPAREARLFAMDGVPIVSFQSEMMVGMWLTAALAAKDQTLIAAFTTRLRDFAAFAPADKGGFWGDVPEAASMYYNQSLTWFGVAMLSGEFKNLYGGE